MGRRTASSLGFFLLLALLGALLSTLVRPPGFFGPRPVPRISPQAAPAGRP